MPVLIDGAKMPSAQDLPDNIVGLAVAPGLPLRAEDFAPDAARLLDRLEPLLKRGSIAVDCGPPGQTQRRWLVPGGGEFFTDFEGGPEMVVVPPGSFTMGSPIDEAGREPENKGSEGQREVKIARAFAVSRFPVTRSQFERFVADTRYQVTEGADFWNENRGKYWRDNRRSWKSPGFDQTGQHPVVAVSWNDAVQYAAWVSLRAGRHYGLLSSVEWEYVARAVTTAAAASTPFWWGRSIGPSQANYDARASYGGGPKGDQREGTSAVDSFEPNPWGLYQVHGNVWEMVADTWQDASTTVMCRGGSFEDTAAYLRSATCGDLGISERYVSVGFRVAREIE